MTAACDAQSDDKKTRNSDDDGFGSSAKVDDDGRQPSCEERSLAGILGIDCGSKTRRDEVSAAAYYHYYYYRLQNRPRRALQTEGSVGLERAARGVRTQAVQQH